MRRSDRIVLEDALRDHYRGERARDARLANREKAVADLAASAVSERSPQPGWPPRLIGIALGSSPRASWLAPAAVLALALAFGLSGTPVREAEAALASSGPVLAAASLAGVVRARSCGMQELEASCMHNSVAVACARLAAFGTACLVALAASCAACASIVPFGAAAAYALAPYLIAAAGGLMLARKASSGDAALAATAWSAGVFASCLLLRAFAPGAYGTAAVWIWAAVAAVGVLWLCREFARWMRLSAEGGCAPEPAAQPSMF